MATHEEIFDKLKRLNKSAMACQVATMQTYEKATNTITVMIGNGLKIPGVRLKAATDAKVAYYEIKIPKAKSTVLIGLIGDKPEAGEYYLIMCDEVETKEFKMNSMKLRADKNGIFAINGTSNLGQLLQDLIDEVKGLNILVVGTAGANPLTVTSAKPNPANIANLTQIAAKIKQVIVTE